MNQRSEILTADLRDLIRQLGRDGGLLSPSVYDTAQVSRFAPPVEGVWGALEWLLDQQQADGGWGDPDAPLARHVPTLAAVLAIKHHSGRKISLEAIQRGMVFLSQTATQWLGELPDDLPVGIELTLPALLDTANQMGLYLPYKLYAPLQALGARRRTLIERMTPLAGSTPAHSWEALAGPADLGWLDASGGIGHSPAATAAWRQRAGFAPETADQRAAAERYLQQAMASVGHPMPGIMPTVWPINRFEQSFGLYVLLITGLLDHPGLRAAELLADLQSAMTPAGLGMSDTFMADGDDTAAACAVLWHSGRPVGPAALLGFKHDRHFSTYPWELQRSLSVTARATHALSISGRDTSDSQAFLVEQQQPDGRWPADKWNNSWLYNQLHAICALAPDHHAALSNAAHALLIYQRADGGWGCGRAATAEETAYATIALVKLLGHGIVPDAIRQALQRAYRWQLDGYTPFKDPQRSTWLGKEMYIPRRVSRIFIAASLLMLARLDEEGGHGFRAA
ncbi:MAG TPA: hypothetical protein VGE07_03200 [Herpetosiphonaceae bacterium]